LETVSACAPAEELPIRYDAGLVTDNCDDNPIVEVQREIVIVNDTTIVGGSDDNPRTIITELGQQINYIYTATDASGNESLKTIPTWFVPIDEAPSINVENTSIQDVLNVCGEYPISAESLGISATDDCTQDLSIEISLFDGNNQPVEAITQTGSYLVTARTTDETGKTASENIFLEVDVNPDAITVTAEDDTFEVPAGESIVFNVLANDMASDGSALEVQDLVLVNPDDGILTDNGDGTYTFTPAEGFVGNVALTYIAKSEDASLFFEGTGNFYEFIAQNDITWQDAKVAAEARILNGVNGYLATVTSQEENDFILSKLEGQGWMGASDEEEEGVWKWVTGPEPGMEFWRGDASGMASNGMYTNWNGGEPNNATFNGTMPEGEDYGHFLDDGKWNDYPVSTTFIEGYVVEYGGVDGCTPDFTDEAMVTITVTEGVAECPTFEIAFFEGTNSTCPTSADGTATIEATCDGCEAGTFEYSFDGGETFQTDNFFDGLAPGLYEGLIVIRNSAFPDCETIYGLEQLGNPDTEAPVLVDASPVNLYSQNFENPNNYQNSTFFNDASGQNVRDLYGQDLKMRFTTETLSINGPQDIYTDPDGSGDNYSLAIWNGQDDLLGLTFNTQGKEFLNVKLDLSAIALTIDGGISIWSNSLGETTIPNLPLLNLKLYDDPNESLDIENPTGTILDETTLEGIEVGETPFTFNWTEIIAGLDASGSTNGKVTLVFDLLGVNNAYAAIDNIEIEASNVSSVDGIETEIEIACLSDLPEALILTAEDNCDGEVPVSFSQSTINTEINDQVITRTWTALDNTGNETILVQTINVVSNGTDCSGGVNHMVESRSDNNSWQVIINPNPFQTETTLQVNLPKEEMVNIDMRDVSGRIVKSLSLQGLTGENSFLIQSDNLASGVYFISVSTTSTQQTIKVVVTQ